MLITRLVTLPYSITFLQTYMYPSVSKVHADTFNVSVIHRTLTWTTGSLTCVSDTHGSWAHRQRASTIFLTFLVLLAGFRNLGSSNLGIEAATTQFYS